MDLKSLVWITLLKTMEFYNPGSGIKIRNQIVNLLSFPFSNFTKREWNFPRWFSNNVNINYHSVKLLRERIVNLQSGNEYLFQIQGCEIQKYNKRKIIVIALERNFTAHIHHTFFLMSPHRRDC